MICDDNELNVCLLQKYKYNNYNCFYDISRTKEGKESRLGDAKCVWNINSSVTMEYSFCDFVTFFVHPNGSDEIIIF